MGMTDRLRVFVSGMIAGDPHQGGATWAVLQYVRGLRQLGHDVYFVEPMQVSSIRPDGAALSESANAEYFYAVMQRFGLGERSALVMQDTRETVGLSYSALIDAARSTDLLINISGMLTDTDLIEAISRRAYLDLDPAFNQLWHCTEGVDMRFNGHTHFVTVGSLIGTPECGIPLCGRVWQHTLQPVMLSEWPFTHGLRGAPWTTVGNWRGYGSIDTGGVQYGQKAHSFRRFMDLPERIAETERVRAALAIHPGEVDDLLALRAHGWELADPSVVAGTPDAYRDFIQTSKGELGIAKSGYVASSCGWFSDRSACYLASGRPVIAQDTGFSRVLPTGEGLFAFNTVDEAVAAIADASANYDRHCRRAREMAEGYFRSDTVLARLLETVGMAAASAHV
jgi:hypothetical protein